MKEPEKPPSEAPLTLRERAEAVLPANQADLTRMTPEEVGRLVHELQVHQIELEMQNEEMHRLHLEMDASRARYFDLYDMAPVGYVTINEAGLVLEANFTAAKILGVSRCELVKQPFTRFIAHDSQDAFYLHLKQLFAMEAPQTFELRMLGHDRQPFWAHLATTLATDADGAAELRIVLSDISESKLAEEELRASEARNQALLSAIPDLIFVNRRDGRFLSYYASDPSLLYASPETDPFLHKKLGDVLPKDVGDKVMQAFAAATATGAAQEVSYALMIGGEEKFFEARVAPANGDNLVTITRDVTARKRAQEALHNSLEFSNSLIHSMQDGFSVLDPAGVALEVNPALCQMTGFSREELIGVGAPHPYWPPEEHERIFAALSETMKGGPHTFELTFMRRNGDRFPVIVSPFSVADKDGKILSYAATVREITELKQAEAELRASEAFQRDILNSLPAHLAVLDPAGVIVEVNEPWLQFARINGTPPIEKIGVGANYLEACHTAWLEGDPYAQAAVDGLESVLAGKQSRFTLDYPCDSPDCARWFSMEVLRPLGGEVGAIVAHTDISERKIAEEALRDANQKLRLHFEQTPMAVIEWDLDFRVTQWNPAARTIFGYSREEALGQHASFIIPKTFHHQVDEIWQALLRKSGGERSTNPNVSKDGTTILCEWYNTPLIDERGTVRGAASVVLDITRQTHDQQLLAWEKSALESINSSAPLATVLNGLMLGLEEQLPEARCSVLLLDADGIHLRTGAAPSLPEAYNRAVDGVAIGPTIGSCGTAAYLKRQVIVGDIASDPLWADYREVATHYDLHACWSTPILCSEGNVLGTFANYYRKPRHPAPEELELIERAVHVMRIAIERKRAEEEILALNSGLEQRVQQRTAELQAANASLTDFKAALDEHAIVAITDVEGTITYANDKFCEISKYSREELLGQTHRLVNSGYHSEEFFRDLWETIKSGRVWKGEIKNRAKDDSTYWVSSTIVPFLGPDGKPSQFISIRTDTTTRKLAEEKINNLNSVLEIRAAALEAANKELEAFSYSVSHDLRAPLRALDGFSRMVLADYAPKLDDEGRRMLGVIHNAAQRMGQLIDDLLAFSRLGRQPIGADRIDMEKLARDVSGELAALEPDRQVRINLHPLPATLGTAAMIRQVWVNLIGNALKFTKDREVAEIEIGAQEQESGEWVYYVKDNGVGFDMRYADKLFGVFQRLHSQQEFPGTGVGLALVQRIVERHGGRIWAEAEVNRGATFHFTLPNQKP